jgi:AcrR family transcriptional regulator
MEMADSKKDNGRSTGKPGRPRSTTVHQAIFDAALALLEEMDLHNVTMENIALRAGTSKTTAYRWWPNKTAVIIDAFLAANEANIPFPDTGSVREDVRLQMRRLGKLLSGPGGRVIGSLMAAGQGDEEVAETFRSHWLKPRKAAAMLVLERGKKRGELAADVDVDLLWDSLYGPIYFRLLTGQSITPKYIDNLNRTIFDALLKKAHR